MNPVLEKAYNAIKLDRAKSKFDKGVHIYALEMLQELNLRIFIHEIALKDLVDFRRFQKIVTEPYKDWTDYCKNRGRLTCPESVVYKRLSFHFLEMLNIYRSAEEMERSALYLASKKVHTEIEKAYYMKGGDNGVHR